MIIFLSGSINSGKSTIAKRLAAKFEKPAVVEGDSLRAFINSTPLEEAIPITLENIVAVVRNLEKHGFTCIVPYPLSSSNYLYITDGLRNSGNIYVFTLSPKMEKVLRDNPDRKITGWEKNRIRHHYTVGIATPAFGFVIDNTNESPDETTERIFKIIQSLSISVPIAKMR